jgi:anti-sigma regulatory factor (Ser/Thr protein kinase)
MAFEHWEDRKPPLHAEQPNGHLVVGANYDAPATARRALRALDAALDRESVEIAALLVTEVVTNAVLHAAGGEIEVSFWVSDGTLDILVEDGGPGFIPRPAPRQPGRAGGWGLYLVDQLVLRWGSWAQPASAVWFTVPIEQ